MNIQSESLFIETVVGSKRISNFIWAFLVLIGASGFLLVSFSSYIGKDIIPFISSQSIVFTPQGLVMCFYGIGGLFLSIYLWCAIFWGVGSGYNEFDRREGIISLFRWGFPGENRRIRIRFFIQDVQTIRLETNETLGSRCFISIRLKGQQHIALTQVGESFTLKQIEEKAAQLASFLRVPIESS